MTQGYSGRPELTWTNKHLRLLGREDGSYEWVPPADYRFAEVRLLRAAGTTGDTHSGRQRAKDNLLIRGDALHALTSLTSIPEFQKEYVGRVKLVYIDPPFNTQQAFEQYDDALEHSASPWLRLGDRAYLRLNDADLDHLLAIERRWRESLELRIPHWRLYRDRLIGICLGQGGAMHLIDGTNGIKDFDLYRFFATHPARPSPDPAIYRGKTHVDFGPSKFGSRSDPGFRALQRRYPKVLHRNVDIFSVALPTEVGADPVAAISVVFRAPPTPKLALIAEKPFVLIDRRPPVVVWPVEFQDAELRGYEGRAAPR